MSLIEDSKRLRWVEPDPTPSHCQAGHSLHSRVMKTIALGGPSCVPDYPPIAHRFRNAFDLFVYEHDEYKDFKGYCTGQDEFSKAILSQGIWEGFETALFLDILSESENGWVLDFGAHLGWYTLLAALDYHNVLAFEADEENLRVLDCSVKQNLCNAFVHMRHCWIDQNTPALDVPDQPVTIMKSDLEGNDVYAVQACRKLFSAQQIDYAMIELSPTFDPDVTEVAHFIARCGYSMYRIPDKGFEHTEMFGEQPLETLKQFCLVPHTEINSILNEIYQGNFLFICDKLI